MDLSKCVRRVPPAASNERRDIWDLLDQEFPVAQHVNVFRFKPVGGRPNVGGNHWHEAEERLLIVSGTMPLLVLKDLQTRKRAIFRDLGPGALITIPGRIAHANVLSPGLILVGAMNLGLTPEDSHPYSLISKGGDTA